MLSVKMKYDVKYEIIKIEKNHNMNLHILETTATGGVINSKHHCILIFQLFFQLVIISYFLL